VDQHQLIRKHAREKHVKVVVLQLLRARQELHELWIDPIANVITNLT
jgi:hypothetical protein